MWNKFKEGFVEGLRSVSFSSLGDVLIAIGVVYILAWLFGEPVDQVVGWVALVLAVAAGDQR
jgi:hypothetical protein